MFGRCGTQKMHPCVCDDVWPVVVKNVVSPKEEKKFEWSGAMASKHFLLCMVHYISQQVRELGLTSFLCEQLMLICPFLRP